ncbi:MAG: hypothetical protein HYX27_23035 [Acidobacteria bacterium]|nr:hypothetical protein [Acidobacteriota bacterium]
MRKFFLSILLAAAVLLGEEYKAEPGAAPPAELADSVKSLLEKQGVKVLKDGKPLSEIWFRAELPPAKPSTEANLTMPGVPHGSLLGVIKVEQAYSDRRGQTFKPGLYTMRYSYYPENGDHQGAAPQRDFLLLSAAAADTDGAATPVFKELVEQSKKVSNTPHPCVFSIWKEDPKFFKEGSLEKVGEHDWVLMHKMGTVGVSLIVAGKVEA